MAGKSISNIESSLKKKINITIEFCQAKVFPESYFFFLNVEFCFISDDIEWYRGREPIVL